MNERARIDLKSNSTKRIKMFPLASPSAEKFLTKNILRNVNTYTCNTPQNESPKNSMYKITLEKLRDITVERFYKFNFNKIPLTEKHHQRTSSRNST